jgi:hypothetical protein
VSGSPEPESSVSDLPDLSPRLLKWVSECSAIRKALDKPDLADGPHALHKQLLQARRGLDRIEEVLTQLVALRGRTRAGMLGAKWALEEAESKAYTSRKIAFGEFTTGREKEAWVYTQTVIEKLGLNRLTLLDEEVGATLEIVRTLHRGIDSFRRDTDSRLRLITFERSLER